MQPFTIRSMLYGPVILALTMLVSHVVSGQPYPTRPIRMVVPSSPGAGVTDIMARLIGQHLSTGIGQSLSGDFRLDCRVF